MNPPLLLEKSALSWKVFDQMAKFPTTRYMGSKYKLLDFIWDNVKDLKFNSVLDAFSGSGSVGYMFKTKGKRVSTNDVLRYAACISSATIENSSETIEDDESKLILSTPVKTDGFICKTFEGLYFEEEEYRFLERIMHNISLLNSKYKKSIAIAALCKACIKKRPRGIFTYTGNRYDDDRKDLRLSLEEHFINAVNEFNQAVFDNGQSNQTFFGNIFSLQNNNFDLVYIDPPYFSLRSDNDYLRRYHFVEGLCSYWRSAEIDFSTKTKKLKKQITRFDSRQTVYKAFDDLFSMFPYSILVVSYSSNSLPTKEEMIELLKRHKKHVKVGELNHKYSFGNHNHKIGNNANSVKEYLFIAH
ncbi:DNA adenine methylase [Candidatus Peregrinibacteria bacterium]|nr:DNA adenine methylase [Candidatus Peregrinibacteria bacterium]